MIIQRTSIRRLSKTQKEALMEHTLGRYSAFNFYLEDNSPNVGVVIFRDENGELIAWGCLDYMSAFPREEGFLYSNKGNALMGWFVAPRYRGQGFAHKLAENLLTRYKKPIYAESKRIPIEKVLSKLGFQRVVVGNWLDTWAK